MNKVWASFKAGANLKTEKTIFVCITIFKVFF